MVTAEGQQHHAKLFRDQIAFVIGREVPELTVDDIAAQRWNKDPQFFTSEEREKLSQRFTEEDQRNLEVYSELLGMMDRPIAGLTEKQIIAMGGGYGTHEDLFPPGAQPPEELIDSRPTVEQSLKEHEAIDNVSAHLVGHGKIYSQGDNLVDVLLDPTPHARPIPLYQLRKYISESVRLVELNDKGKEKEVRPADWLTKAIAAAGNWPRSRKLEAIVESPVLREDGTILQTPGYDPESRLLYIPNAEFQEVLAEPTKSDAKAAVKVLRDLLIDFPFREPIHFAGLARWPADVAGSLRVQGACTDDDDQRQ